jgi:hypothetical protein
LTTDQKDEQCNESPQEFFTKWNLHKIMINNSAKGKWKVRQRMHLKGKKGLHNKPPMVKASIEIKAIDFPRSPNPTACHNKNSRRKSDTTTRDAPFDLD